MTIPFRHISPHLQTNSNTAPFSFKTRKNTTALSYNAIQTQALSATKPIQIKPPHVQNHSDTSSLSCKPIQTQAPSAISPLNHKPPQLHTSHPGTSPPRLTNLFRHKTLQLQTHSDIKPQIHWATRPLSYKPIQIQASTVTKKPTFCYIFSVCRFTIITAPW